MLKFYIFYIKYFMQKISEAVNHAIKAMGLVFGDIGTNPIYTMPVIFLTTEITEENIFGVLSLIVWTLIIIVTVQYAWFAMSLSKRGEGGVIVLNQILKRHIKSLRAETFFSYLAYIGISLLIGDSVLTPAISILSAVEGISLIDKFTDIPHSVIILIAVVITVALFSIQKKGAEKVSQMFGPVMLIWFLSLFISGFLSFIEMPSILLALNPMFGLKFLFANKLASFFVLSQIILCATGAEALYADMGHMGRKPIIHAWVFVFFALVFSYLGQGVFLLKHSGIHSALFSMILNQNSFLYIPFLILSLSATVIASQSMISGAFSLVYQAINTKILPYFKTDFTSTKLKSQIYIGAVNWFLLVFVIAVILFFKKSSNLAHAYGFAVAGAILITGIIIAAIFFAKKKYFYFIASLGLVLVDFSFFLATCTKIHLGAYWSISIAAIPFSIILLYIKGQKALHKALGPQMSRNRFLKKYNKILPEICKISGTALFFIKNLEYIPHYVINTMLENNIVYSDNVFVSIYKTNEPHGIEWEMEEITEGLRQLKISGGYMEIINLESIFKKANIKEKTIFYGVEQIETNNFFWNIYAKINKILPPELDFYKLPLYKVHGITTLVIMK